MHRFFEECRNDPALVAVLALALIFVLVVGWFVVKDTFVKRQKEKQRGRRRSSSHRSNAQTPERTAD
jgi:hypothetical protein